VTGLYVHVPFCLTRCGYCDFNAYAGLGHLSERYAGALRAEAGLAAPAWRSERFHSVFFGGGTPTTLSPSTLVGILAELRDLFDVAPDAEVTVEANPDTVDECSLAQLVAGGFNRLSMGAQSFDPEVLKALERVHGPDSVRPARRAAGKAGFANVNVDLIFGTTGETMESWRRTMEEAVALAPDHLSCYALTVEPATPLGRKIAAGLLAAPDPDVQADMFEEAVRFLEAERYLHYEVSNWCRPGFECRHNLGYWGRQAYLGLGAGAHSYRDGRRWWNVRPPAAYLQAAEEGTLPVGGDERLGSAEARLEEVFLALRTREGLPVRAVPAARARPYLAQGLLRREGGRLVLTDRGMFLANDVALALVD
jgi:putative oxygen-independent coproporphyrinogen III oxidase